MAEKTIVQRIAMDGGDSIREELAALGNEARAAFGELKSAVEDGNKAGKELKQSLDETKKGIDSIHQSAQGLRRMLVGAVGAVAAFLGTRELIRATSAWTDYTGQVQRAIGPTEDVRAAMARLVEIANRTFSAVDQTMESFLRFSPILSALGLNMNEQLDVVEAMNNALVVSGAKGDRAATVSEALARAFALGELRGQNLNTVLAQGGRIAELLADHFRVNINELRSLGEQGRITSAELVKAFRDQGSVVRAEADAMATTIEDAVTIMRNNFLAWIGDADQMSGASRLVAEGILQIANNLDTVIPLLITFVGALALTKVVAFGQAIFTLIAGLAALGPLIVAHPVTALAVALGAAALAMLYFTGQLDPFIAKAGEFARAVLGIGEAVEESATQTEGASARTSQALATIGQAGTAAAGEVRASMADAAGETESLWELATDWISGRFQAMGEDIAGVWETIVDGARAAWAWVKRLISGANQAAAATADAAPGFRTGGSVSGPGTGTSDSILARLSNGEYVIRAAAVRALGRPILDALNSGRLGWRDLKASLRGFADGGLVDMVQGSLAGMAPRPARLPALAARGDGGRKSSLTLVLDGQSFGPMVTPESVADNLVRAARRKALVRTGRMPGWYEG